jgi:Na+-driven multidrug efflux pump
VTNGTQSAPFFTPITATVGEALPSSTFHTFEGAGHVHVPALVTCGGVVAVISLSPCLIFGLGPFPQLGVAGGGVALLAYYAVGSVVLAAYIRSGRIPFVSVFRPSGCAGSCLQTFCASASFQLW